MDGLLIAKVRGIAIRAHISVLVVGALIAWSLATEVLPEFAEGYSTTEYWIAGAISTVAFLAGLVAHELGHSLVALRNGVGVRSITLWLFGGIAELDGHPSEPRAALHIAAAGPAVSFALAAIAAATAPLFDGLVQQSVLWFAAINVILAVFNLLPAFPMDGGRIYQAWRWQRTGDPIEATDRAASIGLVLSTVMIAVGAAQALFSTFVGGIWLILIGLFIREAANAEVRQAHLQGPLDAINVRQVMSDAPITVNASTPVSGFVAGLLFGGRHAAYPVLDDDGSVFGLLSLNAIRGTTQDDWVGMSVRDIATPRTELVVVHPSDPINQALSAMGRRNQNRALVLDGDDLVGIVAPSDITRLITVVESLAMPAAAHGKA